MRQGPYSSRPRCHLGMSSKAQFPTGWSPKFLVLTGLLLVPSHTLLTSSISKPFPNSSLIYSQPAALPGTWKSLCLPDCCPTVSTNRFDWRLPANFKSQRGNTAMYACILLAAGTTSLVLLKLSLTFTAYHWNKIQDSGKVHELQWCQIRSQKSLRFFGCYMFVCSAPSSQLLYKDSLSYTVKI